MMTARKKCVMMTAGKKCVMMTPSAGSEASGLENNPLTM
jgi:hypothetical protein